MRSNFVCAATLVALAVTAASAQAHNYFYFSDYISANLDRVNVNPDASIVTVGGVPDVRQVVHGGIKEGIDGTANTVIVAESGGQTVARFDRATGTRIGLVTSHTFNGIGMIALTKDAQTMYVTDEPTGTITKIDMATGNVLASVGGVSAAHDIAVAADGTVYVTGYTGNTGIVRFDANLGNKYQLVAPGDNGLNRPVGIAINPTTGNLWVESNTIYQNQPYGATVNYAKTAIN